MPGDFADDLSLRRSKVERLPSVFDQNAEANAATQSQLEKAHDGE